MNITIVLFKIDVETCRIQSIQKCLKLLEKLNYEYIFFTFSHFDLIKFIFQIYLIYHRFVKITMQPLNFDNNLHYGEHCHP